MYDSVAVVIPALDRNRYYSEGDLVRFGDTTLLEWKISQVLEVVNRENIYISTPSEKILGLVRDYGLNGVKRTQETDQNKWISESVEPVEKENILWTYVTAPFISSGDYRCMLETFFGLPEKYDSLISVYKEQEYILYKETPLNFNIDQYKIRKEIEPVYRVTNGCYITPKENYRQNLKYFGRSLYYYEVDKLTSLEIKDIDHYEMALNLLSMYFKTKEI